MQNQLVSIFIPVYNAGRYLRPSLESILCQSYERLEIIIIDDGSTDGCISTILDIKDQRIKILRQRNYGKPTALNRALEIMNGHFYAIQDADDISYPRRIEYLLNTMNQHPEVAGVFSGYDIIFNEKHTAPVFRYKSIEECRKDIHKMRMPSHDPTAMYRTSMVKDFRYEPTLTIGEGLDYILRVGEQYSLIVIGECLYSYRINQFSLTRSNTDRIAEKVQIALSRAYERRGKIYKLEMQKKKRKMSAHDAMVPQFMESVLDFKRIGRGMSAFKTALQFLTLNPYRFSHYKPIIYFFIPLYFINQYREIKENKKIPS